MKRHVLVLVPALVLAVACGGSAGNPKASSNNSPSPSTSPTAGSSSAPAPAGTTTPGGSSPKSSPKSSVTPSPTAPAVSASLDKPCVRRGASTDKQGLRIRTTPRGPYGYATVYSDGSDITGHPEYDPDGPNGPIGGQGGSFADPSGNAYEQWIVPPRAPTGEATVKVNAGGTIFELKFTVVGTKDSCP